ncbi:hypothetical protein P8452_25910 [Trifolium repens]|nr:hypothetical protein P8452_25910 [Trifolium repens]
MWRTIHMTDDIDISKDLLEYGQIFRYAVKLSCGHLEDIDIVHFATDDLLKCIAQNASNLRSLHLVACRRISDREFIEAVRKLSRLEELDISECVLYEDCLEVIGMSCPLLKSLKFCKTWIPYPVTDGDDDEALIISETMSRLSCLDIKGNRLTNVGLLAILDGCPLLECLDMQECYNLSLGESLRKRCIEKIKDLRLPVLNLNYENFDHGYDGPLAFDWDLDADDDYQEYLYFYDDFYDPFD